MRLPSKVSLFTALTRLCIFVFLFGAWPSPCRVLSRINRCQRPSGLSRVTAIGDSIRPRCGRITARGGPRFGWDWVPAVSDSKCLVLAAFAVGRPPRQLSGVQAVYSFRGD